MSRRGIPVCALTIAGSDSGGGAGVQADARVMRLLGVHACTAITALTAQNTLGVIAVDAVSGSLIRQQAEAVLGDMPVRAVKTGLLPSAQAVRAVVRALKAHPDVPLVVDPVVASSSGTRFLDDKGLAVLRAELLPRATLVTPNWPELALLTGQKVCCENDALEAAANLVAQTGASVLAKGGHSGGAACTDLLLTPGARLQRFAGRRVATPNDHGTGCSLSAGIKAHLALGRGLPEAIRGARRVLRAGLIEGKLLRWGGGAGPAVG